MGEAPCQAGRRLQAARFFMNGPGAVLINL